MALQQLVNFPVTTNFRIQCPELPLLSELAQDCTLPTLTINPAEVFTRTGDYGQVGEKINFTELDVGFSMDEYLDVYAEIYSWMNRMCGMPGFQAVEEKDREVLFCNIDLIMLDNNQKESRRFIFHDVWPSSIGAIALDQAGEAITMKGLVTFEYTAIEMKPDTKNLTQLGDLRYNH